jgi:lysophospholipid acyltransferase (LPLAT)-like uncharacterized protein
MAKLFRFRELLIRYPWLDWLRHRVVTLVCRYGIAFFDHNYRRIEVIAPGARPYVDDGQPVIYAVYHGCMVALLGLHPRNKVTILVSNSRDGEMIAQAARGLGFSTARGSTGQGAVKGIFELLEAAKNGQKLAMLVDGPKGPRHVVKTGVLKLAQMTGLPILPVGLSSRSAWWPDSWDRYTAASWGSPLLTVFDEPITVPQEATDEQIEELRVQLDHRMRELHEISDQVWKFSDGKRVSGLIA